MIINDLFTNKRTKVAEGMAGKVVFLGTGANGGKYEIIQSSPTDFMIHANGRHIDTYGSLQRAMSVLQNEVPGLQQGMAEGKADYNFDIEDLKRLEQIRDLATLKAQAFELISRPSAKPMKPEKVEWFRNALERMNSPLKVIKLMYDLLLSGEGKAVVGTRSSMNPNTYRQRFGEQGMAENNAVNVPPGQQATTQSDGSTRISKIGSMPSAEYKKNMADYKAKNWTPDKIADFKQRMASGQGYTDTERQANLQQQQQYFGKFADTGDLDEQGMAEGWRDIYNLNKQKIGTNPNLIKPDTVLKMPDGSRYKVKPGDNLSSIAKISGAKSAQPSTSTSSKAAVVPKYYSLPPDAAAAVKPAPVKPAAAHDDSPYIFDPRSGQGGVKPDRIADVFQNPKLPPPLTRDEIEQQMMQPDFGGPNAPGYKHTVQGAEGEEYEFDSGQEAKDFVDRIEQLRLRDRALGGLGAAKSESISSKKKGMAEDDGFDVVSNYQNMRTTDTGNKSNQTYTSTTIAKNPTTGQQQSLASWDHTDPKTGKNYSGSNYIDAQGNAEVQKNYEESKNKVNEVSLGDYRKKATVNKALAQTNKFFGRDDPAKVAAADQTIAKRERGLGRADARGRPYTAPPVDQAKQRRDLADKYPNIDELVRQAELNRDPDYEYADGQAYYAGRDAEHNYHRLKQIQRMIRGAELDEMNFGGVNQTTDSATGDVTTNFSQGPFSVSQTKTPGGYTKQTDQQFNLGTATLGARTVGPNIGAGQLAGTTTKTATNNMTGQAKQQVKGVGFGGATGAKVGKNYVGASDDELARLAADSVTGINENTNRIRHLAGIKPVK